MNHEQFMRLAIKRSIAGMNHNEGGPFGAVVVKDGEVIGSGNNKVISLNDPTAHAEIIAIRAACAHLNNFQLNGCTIYTSCEPCPMCLGAIYWARPEKVYFGCKKSEAADAGFDDAFIYNEIELPYASRRIPFEQLLESEARVAFERWKSKEDKIEY